MHFLLLSSHGRELAAPCSAARDCEAALPVVQRRLRIFFNITSRCGSARDSVLVPASALLGLQQIDTSQPFRPA